jgi:hypothetical protein
MALLYNMVQMTVASSPGTGTIQLGSAVTDSAGITYLTLTQSGAVDGDIISYRISDGVNWELARGIVGSGRTTLTRGLLRSSTGGPLNASSDAIIEVVPLAEDFFDDPGITGIAAGGTTQSTATQLSKVLNIITTVPVAEALVALPPGRLGRRCIIKNAHPDFPIGVVPRLGDSARINREPVDGIGLYIQPDSMAWFSAESGTQWHV